MLTFYKLVIPIVILIFIALLRIHPFVLYPCIVGVVILSLFLLNFITTPRSYNYLTTKKFLESKDEIYFIGSSRTYTTFNAKIIEEYTDYYSVYTYGIDSLTFTLASYLAKELMKKHKPKVIIMDSYYITDTYRNNNIMLDEDYKGILTALNGKQREEFAQLYKKDSSTIRKDIMSYKELTSENIMAILSNDRHLDMYKGFVPITEPREIPTEGHDFVPEDTHFKNIKTSNKSTIHNQYQKEVLYLLKLANANNIKLLFIDIPIYSEDLSKEILSCEYSNYLTHFAEKTNQESFVINLNKHTEDLEITPDDFDDSMHLMESGSEIVSHYTGRILKEYLANLKE